VKDLGEQRLAGPALRLVINRAVSEEPDVISTRRLAVGFGNRTVLSGLDLGFRRGKVTALVGPSGSGKSTFLRTLNRLNDDVPGFWHTGEVLLEGQDIYSKEVDPLALRARVGMVFQRPNPFPMSIEANVVAGVRVHRLARKRELREVAKHYLSLVGLYDAVKDRLGDSPFRLSGGQQQLLCLARCLATQPTVLLLDEPTSSLDPMSSKKVEELLLGLVPSMTIVIVTHNLAQARRLADYAVFFWQGEALEHGTAGQVLEDPLNEVTQQFVTGAIG
jgi:phosphate transport system ATP-binding protein